MYPTNKELSDSDRKLYEAFRNRINSTHSSDKLREEYTPKEIEKLIKQGNKLPKHLRGVGSRLKRLVIAQIPLREISSKDN